MELNWTFNRRIDANDEVPELDEDNNTGQETDVPVTQKVSN